MKHWDLRPNETVTIRRGVDDAHEPAGGNGPNTLQVIFRFHTTLWACFETADHSLLWFEALDDGSLAEVCADSFLRRRWHVVGADRNSRWVFRLSLGERQHLTATDAWTQRAAKAGAS